VCEYLFVCVCVCACLYVCICIYIYIYILLTVYLPTYTHITQFVHTYLHHLHARRVLYHARTHIRAHMTKSTAYYRSASSSLDRSDASSTQLNKTHTPAPPPPSLPPRQTTQASRLHAKQPNPGFGFSVKSARFIFISGQKKEDKLLNL
jgi:hypothetical protein